MTADLHSLAGLYALDALDELDAARFERHLAQCEQCRIEVREFQEAAHRLAVDVKVPAPAALRAEVLQAIAVTPQVRRRQWRGARVGRSVAVLLGAAAAVVLVLLGAALVRSQAELSKVREMAAALSDPAAPRVTLDGELGITATLVRSATGDALVVALADLPPVEPDRAYAIWLIGADGPKPMALVRPDHSGRAMAMVKGDLDRFVGFGLTNEPAAGSHAPTGPPLVTGELPTVAA